MEITVASYNPNHLYHPDDPYSGSENRYEVAEEIIRNISPHILLIQEIAAKSQEQAEQNARHLAEATNLRCELPDGSNGNYAVLKSNTHNLANGVLWHPDIEPLRWQSLPGFWHGFGMLAVNINGVQVNYGCYHGQPAGWHTSGDTRPEEARRIGELAAAQEPDSLTIIGGDWNSISADQVDGEYYDHRTVSENADAGFRRFVLDRTPGQILRAAGLIDVAVARSGTTPASKADTEGPTEKEGSRRNDIFRASQTVMRLVSYYDVIITPDAIEASDHLPIVMRHGLPT